MFARLSLLALAAASFALAAPQSATVCSGGPIQCCSSIQPASSSDVINQLALLGIDAGGINVPVGLDCTPISVAGGGGNSCQQQVACCDDTSNGIIGIGCNPIGLGL